MARLKYGPTTKVAKHIKCLEFEAETKQQLKDILKTKNIDLESDMELNMALEKFLVATHLRLKIQGR